LSRSAGSPDETPRFVFWFYWGAEVRSYLFSGLIEELSRTADVVVLTRKIPAGVEEIAGQGVEFRQLPEITVSRLHGWLVTLANHVHLKWLENRKEVLAVGDRAAVPLHAWGWKKRAKVFLGGILGHAGIVQGLGKMEAIAERRTARRLAPLVPARAGNVMLISGDYLSPGGAGIAAAVTAAGGESVFFPLNWRDVYKGARLRRMFTTWLFWNEDMRRTALSFNPVLAASRTGVVGALQFDGHFREEWREDREPFLGSVGLDPSRPVMCYSAVAENAFAGEAALVVAILKALERSAEGKRIQLLVRLNPAGSDPAYDDLPQRFPGRVAVYRPELEDQPSGGPPWKSPSLRDARFFSNTIRHCGANIGLPSTVMLDFGVLGKSSICIGFSGEAERGVRRFLEQPFFREAQARQVWPIAEDPEQAARLLLRLVHEPACEPALSAYLADVVGEIDGKNHRRVANLLRSLGTREGDSMTHA